MKFRPLGSGFEQLERREAPSVTPLTPVVDPIQDNTSAEVRVIVDQNEVVQEQAWNLQQAFEDSSPEWDFLSQSGDTIESLKGFETNNLHGNVALSGYSKTEAPPWAGINNGTENQDPFGGVVWKPGEIVVHPYENTNVIISWKSQQDGTLTFSGSLRDAHPKGGDGVSYIIELIQDDTTEIIAEGTIPRGGSAIIPQQELQTTEGTELRTTIKPQGTSRNPMNMGYDSTATSFSGTFTPNATYAREKMPSIDPAAADVFFTNEQTLPAVFEQSESIDPQAWNIANGFTDEDSPWSFHTRDRSTDIDKQLQPKENLHDNPNLRGFVSDGILPWAGINTSNDVQDVFYKMHWQPGEVLLHPSDTENAVVIWTSPIDGEVEASVTVRDAHGHNGDGVSYILEHTNGNNRMFLAHGMIERGRMENATDGKISLDVQKGDKLSVVIKAEGSSGVPDYGYDSTGIEFAIQTVGADLQTSEVDGIAGRKEIELPFVYPNISDSGRNYILMQHALAVTGLGITETPRNLAAAKYPDLFGDGSMGDIDKAHELACDGRNHGYEFEGFRTQQRGHIAKAERGRNASNFLLGYALKDAYEVVLKERMGLPVSEDERNIDYGIHPDATHAVHYIGMPQMPDIYGAIYSSFNKILAVHLDLHASEQIQSENQRAFEATAASTPSGDNSEKIVTNTEPDRTEQRIDQLNQDAIEASVDPRAAEIAALQQEELVMSYFETGVFTSDGSTLTFSQFSEASNGLSESSRRALFNSIAEQYVNGITFQEVLPIHYGVELQTHTAFLNNVSPFQHLSLLITPTDQEKYRDDPRFVEREDGTFVLSLGAGPDPHCTPMQCRLQADINRPKDIEIHILEQRIPLAIPDSYATEDEWIDALLNMTDAYDDQLDYDLFSNPPEKRAWWYADSGNNSNSFVSGLLDATGVDKPDLYEVFGFEYWRYPGWDQPVPANELIK